MVYPHTVEIFVDILRDFWAKLEYILYHVSTILRPIVFKLLECLLCSLIMHLTIQIVCTFYLVGKYTFLFSHHSTASD